MTRALVVLRVACALLVLAAGNVNSLPKAQPSGPRIALLFMTQGPMPLEENWKRFFEGVQGLHPPQLAPAQLAQLLQKQAINQLDHQLRVAGVMQHSNAVRKAPCISNQVLMVRAPAGTLAEGECRRCCCQRMHSSRMVLVMTAVQRQLLLCVQQVCVK